MSQNKPASNVDAYVASLRELQAKVPPGHLAAAIHRVLLQQDKQREIFPEMEYVKDGNGAKQGT